MDIQTEARDASLADLAEMLKQQADVKYDVVVPARSIVSREGLIGIADGAVEWTDEGATSTTAWLNPTEVFDDGLAEKLSIPRAYVRRMRTERLDLVDANVNGWLQDDREGRSFLVRGFRTDDSGSIGIARAFLSDRFRPVDNYDVLLAALSGIRAAGVNCNIVGADLSEKRMSVKVVAPEVMALAPELLRNYRNPFDGASEGRQAAMRAHGWINPDDRPVVFAGFVISNSETGGGAFTIVPRIIVQVCTNGLVQQVDALREIHLGGRLEAGLIRWSEDTQRKSIDLVKAKTADAVKTFLDVEYVRGVVERLEAKAGKPVVEATATIQRLAKAQSWTQGEAETILEHFLMGGQATAGGVMQAVTSAAQTVGSPDRAWELESSAVAVMELV